jgi:hypothetical protein
MQPVKRSYEELTVGLLRRLQDGNVLTDVNPGSVVRTLVEAFARELAEAYEQMQLVYDMAFLDTATGDALSRLVALIGEQRYAGQQAVGEAIFQRDPRVAGQLTIAAGTELEVVLPRLPGRSLHYRTRHDAVLAAGQNSVTVEIYTELPPDADPEQSLILPGEVPVIATPAVQTAGIGNVTISEPTGLRGQAETDPELRERVKQRIAAAGGGTREALRQAALKAGARAVLLRDAADQAGPGDKRLEAGQVEAVVDVTPEQLTSVRHALNSAKGPGILVLLRTIDQWQVAFELTIRLSANLGPDQRSLLYKQVEQTVARAVEALQPGEKLRWNPLMASLLHLSGVADVESVQAVRYQDGTAGEPVVMVEGGATQLVEFPSIREESFSQYCRLVLAQEGRPVTVHLADEQVVYVGVDYDRLKPADGTTAPDSSRVSGALQERLDDYLQQANQSANRLLDPAALLAQLQSVLKDQGLTVEGFRIAYNDTLRGVEATLFPGTDAPLTFPINAVLRPDPRGVPVTKRGNQP